MLNHPKAVLLGKEVVVVDAVFYNLALIILSHKITKIDVEGNEYKAFQQSIIDQSDGKYVSYSFMEWTNLRLNRHHTCDNYHSVGTLLIIQEPWYRYPLPHIQSGLMLSEYIRMLLRIYIDIQRVLKTFTKLLQQQNKYVKEKYSVTTLPN